MDERLKKLSDILDSGDTKQALEYVAGLLAEKSAKEQHFEEVKQWLTDKEDVVISVDKDNILYTAGNDVFGASVEIIKGVAEVIKI